MYSYLKNHWYGRHSLLRIFILNISLAGFMIYFVWGVVIFYSLVFLLSDILPTNILVNLLLSLQILTSVLVNIWLFVGLARSFYRVYPPKNLTGV